MLRRDPFDAEDALCRVLIADCDGVLIARGVVQGPQSTGCGCRAFVGDGLTTAHNEFAARVGNRFGYEGEILLIVPVLVPDCDLGDVVGRWLGLSMEGLNHSSAKRSARDHSQPAGDISINHVSPDFAENGGCCSRPAPAREDYGYDQLGLGARLAYSEHSRSRMPPGLPCHNRAAALG